MSDPRNETPEHRTARYLRVQAEACGAMGSAMYDTLLRHAADDLLRGGPTRQVLDGHLEDPGPSALALRMMGGVHALVLSGATPELARFYPSVTPLDEIAGKDAAAWPAFCAVLEQRRDEISEWLRRPPQTNEVGRGAALVGGLRHIAAEAQLPIRLVEVGSSAGLNLRADRFRIDGDVGRHGEPSSPVQLGAAWRGVAPPDGMLDIVDRYGADIDPVDVSTDAGRLLLTAYVWPDQVARLERLRGAFALADAMPLAVHRESAQATVERTRLVEGTWTVIWH